MSAPSRPQSEVITQRLKWLRLLAIIFVIALFGRLVLVQVVWAPKLSAMAQQQRERIYVDPARRGEIKDRNGNRLAYTLPARSLTVSPNVLRKEMQQRHEMNPENYPDVEGAIEQMAEGIPQMLGRNGASTEKVNSDDIRTKLHADSNYEVLVRNVDPDLAVEVASRFQGIAADRQDIREYPNGAIAENVVGKISMDGEGQFGFEASSDALLSGIDGRVTEDVANDEAVLPGSLRDQIPVINGADVTLTLDLDLQTFVQQQLEQAVANSGAKSASAVVLDAKTAQILAMANSDTIDPNGNIGDQLEHGKTFDNSSVTSPFEPGSVAKIITATAAIEDGLTTPDEVLTVPGSINMAGVNVRDAWEHGDVQYTTTGVFGKSSNVGTLMLAQRVGEDRFAEFLDKFGIGKYTGVSLPSESPGLLPAREQWSGGTFANLPIGQGMSVTLLQMAGIYQAVANDGVRIEPRIIKEVTRADGTVEPRPEPKKTVVMSPQTSKTVRDMFQAVTQRDPSGVQQGTGPQAGVAGYQISGKTGTAQQVDPACNCYSNSNYWITFAGIAPADNPRYVVALMLDNPQRGVHGEGGQSAAPLFHDIATWLLDRDNVPLSPPLPGQLILQRQ